MQPDQPPPPVGDHHPPTPVPIDAAKSIATADPEDMVKQGQWTADSIVYTSQSSVRRYRSGRAYRNNESGTYTCFITETGDTYRVGDSVYLDSQRPDEPFFIANIQAFRMRKRDHLHVLVKWFYRPTEIPDTVYRALVHDRHYESEGGEQATNKPLPRDAAGHLTRELFISDCCDTYAVGAIRGNCLIYHYKDISQAQRDFSVVDGAFFYILGYNPENNRLASIQGEIRVGSSHQARLPECKAGEPVEDDRVLESPVWLPDQIADTEMKAYLASIYSQAATRVLLVNGSCNSENAHDVTEPARQDAIIDLALRLLHQCDYNTHKAAETALSTPLPVPVIEKWNDEDAKKFVKGVRQFGKNFFKIRRELLPHKQTGELIEYYYLWKKTPGAKNARPSSRQRRPQNILRRIKPGTKQSRPPSNEFEDHSSASENEVDSEDSEGNNKATIGYACHHCYTTRSRDWHHAGKDRALLCTDCRLHFKQYGELPTPDESREPPAFMYKPIQTEGEGIRTRRNKENGKSKRTGSSVPGSPSNGTQVTTNGSTNGRKSPGSQSTSSNSSTGGDECASVPDSGKKSPRSNKNGRKRTAKTSGGNEETETESGNSNNSEESNDAPAKQAKLVEETDLVNGAAVLTPPLSLPPLSPKPPDSAQKSSTASITVSRTLPVPLGSPPLLCRHNLPEIPPHSSHHFVVKTEPVDAAVDTDPAKPDDTLVLQTNSGNSRFIRVLKRPENTCARTDLRHEPGPQSDAYKRRMRQQQAAAAAQLESLKMEPGPSLRPDLRPSSVVGPHFPPGLVPHNYPIPAQLPNPVMSPFGPAMTPFSVQAAAHENSAYAHALRDMAAMSRMAVSTPGIMPGAFESGMFSSSPGEQARVQQILSGAFGPNEKVRMEHMLLNQRRQMEVEYQKYAMAQALSAGGLPHGMMGGFPGSSAGLGMDPRLMDLHNLSALNSSFMGGGIPADVAQRLSGFNGGAGQPYGMPAAMHPAFGSMEAAALDAQHRLLLEQRLASQQQPPAPPPVDPLAHPAVSVPQHHTHTHSHTHLHIHPSDGAPAPPVSAPPSTAASQQTASTSVTGSLNNASLPSTSGVSGSSLAHNHHMMQLAAAQVGHHPPPLYHRPSHLEHPHPEQLMQLRSLMNQQQLLQQSDLIRRSSEAASAAASVIQSTDKR